MGDGYPAGVPLGHHGTDDGKRRSSSSSAGPLRLKVDMLRSTSLQGCRSTAPARVDGPVR
jgi:hypothetical protein